MNCNLCGCTDFVDMKSRKNVKCRNCGSLERTRLLWLYLQRMRIGVETKVLHMAPEKAIYEALSKAVSSQNYTTADLDPKGYPFSPNCKRIDLCDLDKEASFQYDLIIHSHVLEHTPCNIAYTLFHIHRMLKEDGTHVFIAPFLPGKYDECFDVLSKEERVRRFGQWDHVRRFGREDIRSHIGSVVDMPDEFDVTNDFAPEELRQFNIPENHWKGFHIGTVLRLARRDMKFLGEF